MLNYQEATDRKSALMLASLKGQAEVVTILLQHQANVNLLSHGNISALMLASVAGSVDVVNTLFHA